MKIGIDAHSLEGRPTGVGRILLNLLLSWQKLGLEKEKIQLILYFKDEIPELSSLSGSFFIKKLLSKPLNLSSNALFMHWSLAKQARRDRVDILFCPEYVSPITYFGKTVLILHDIIYEARPRMYNWPSFWDKILLKKFSKISAKRANLILTPSEFSKQEVIKHYKINSEKILPILSPLSPEHPFRPICDINKLEQIKKKYHINNKFVFYVGSVFNRRHLDKAISAFFKIASKLSEYQFLIVGKNHTAPKIDIDGLANKINLKLGREAVLREDYVSDNDLVLLYNAADLVVWLSDYEGFGLPVMEPILCHTPVVTTCSSSLPEAVGKGALYVDEDAETEEISEAIYRGITDRDLRYRLIKDGLKHIKESFDWKKSAKDILKAIKAL